MTAGAQDPGRFLKTDRRTELDGGIDNRAGVFTAPNRVLALQNFRLGERGSLTKRRGGSKLATINAASAAPALPAPTVTENLGGGTLPAGTYRVSYALQTVLGTTVGISTAVDLVVSLNSSLTVKIPPLNSGEGVGTVAPADDPFNGGYTQTGTSIAIYARQSVISPVLKQSPVFSWDGSALAQVATLTSMNAGGAAAPALNPPIPMRSIFWHPGLDATLGFIGDRAVHFSGAHTSASYLARATDSSGNAYGFSRYPTRIHDTIIANVAVVSDGIAKPKKLNIGTLSDPTTWDWRVLGANTPAAPTQTLIAGGLTGAYLYRVTFTYTTTRPDGTTYTVESNQSATVTANPAGQGVRVTRPATNSESGITSWSVYRTVAGGTQVFLVSTAAQNIAIATTTFDDAIADASLLTTITPPVALSAKDHSPPPAGLYFVTEHAGVLFGVQRTIVMDGSNRIDRLRMTNVVQYSLFDGTIGGSVDCWPGLNAVTCGAFSPITKLKSFRGILYVFKQDEVGVIEGDTNQNFAYRTIWKGSGAMENSVVEADEALWCFDQARGPLKISGFAVEDYGYETIQDGWAVPAPIVQTAGQARTGGGRGGAMPIAAIWDPVQSEVRWVISDFSPQLSIGASASYDPVFYEYVMQKLPSGDVAFTIFTGSVSGSVKDRRITGMCQSVIGANAVYQARDTLYCDWNGFLVRDDQVEGDLDNTTDITFRAVIPFWFGDSPEMVKNFRHFFMMLLMGATVTDTLTVSLSSLSKQAASGTNPVTISTQLGGASAAPAQASGEVRMIRMDPSSVDGTNLADRGAIMFIDGTAKSGPLKIRELCLKYLDLDDLRNAP